MSLPDYKEHLTHSDADVEHIVARRVAALQMAHLEYALKETDVRVAELAATMNAKFDSILTAINARDLKLDICRSEVKAEIKLETHEDFLTKIGSMQMEKRIEDAISALDKKIDAIEVKFDKQWIKLTVAFTVISSVIAMIYKVSGF